MARPIKCEGPGLGASPSRQVFLGFSLPRAMGPPASPLRRQPPEESAQPRAPGKGECGGLGIGMEDFYVTIPYGLLLLAGGVAGYVKRGSAASLAAGGGFGAALLLAGALSAWAFARGAGGAAAIFATVLQIGPLPTAALFPHPLS